VALRLRTERYKAWRRQYQKARRQRLKQRAQHV
jgi:hypothetical protein